MTFPDELIALKQYITWPVVIATYALLINLVAFIMYGVDKHRAQKNGPHRKSKKGREDRPKNDRISEAALIWIAVFGGSIGAIMGMFGFHHKTQHKKFTILLPLIFLLQVALIGYWIYTSKCTF